MIDLTEIHSLSDFQRNSKDFIGRLKKTGKPAVLTVNGKAEVIVQDAASYQKILDMIDRAEAIEGIRRGIEAAEQGGTVTLEQFDKEMRKKYSIPKK
jgi:PHD/YefM family antitoxin component YafN of YafNO toxin-antitoxin module